MLAQEHQIFCLIMNDKQPKWDAFLATIKIRLSCSRSITLKIPFSKTTRVMWAFFRTTTNQVSLFQAGLTSHVELTWPSDCCQITAHSYPPLHYPILDTRISVRACVRASVLRHAQTTSPGF